MANKYVRIFNCEQDEYYKKLKCNEAIQFFSENELSENEIILLYTQYLRDIFTFSYNSD